jgi:hypothetical protein
MKTLNLSLYDKADNVLKISVVDSEGIPYEYEGINTIIAYMFNNHTPQFEVDLTFDGTYYNGLIPKETGLEPIDYYYEWKNINDKITFPIKGKLAVSSVYRDSTVTITGEVTV